MQTTRRQTLMLSLAMLAGAGSVQPLRADDAWQSGRVVGEGEDALERELADGTLLRLAGILPAPGRGWTDRLAGALAALLPKGAGLGYRALATDRYGRTLAVLAPPAGSALPNLQSLLLTEGLAWAWPEPEAIGLHDGWLAVEARARVAAAGLWGDAGGGLPQPVDDPKLEAALGRPNLWRGRILRVERRRGWTYCDCGADWKTDASISIPDRLLKPLAARGVAMDALAGRVVEARGVPIWRYGPALELWHPAQLVVLDGAES